MRLVLHIGAAKTGSSAIQTYLANNSSVLAKQGVLIPGETLDLSSFVSGQQIDFFEALPKVDNPESVINARLTALRDHMESCGQHTLILSAENLINRDEFAFERLFREAADKFDLKIVVYVRRQDDYLISAWQQWYLKVFPSFRDYLTERLGRDAAWFELLEPWAKAFGENNLIVRRFGRGFLLKDDVVSDFNASAEIPSADCVPLSGLENRSFDEHLADMLHRIRDVFASQHDNEQYRLLYYAIGPMAFKTRSATHLVSLKERLNILRAYEEDNELLKEKYFIGIPREEPLFPLPTLSEVVALDELEKLRQENAMLMRAILGLATRVEKLERDGKPTASA